MRLRWKKHPRETGLRSVGAGPQPSDLHDGEKQYATVYPIGGDWRRRLSGWYFVSSKEAVGQHVNTCDSPFPDEATAKAKALEFVKSRLEAMRG